MSPKLKAILLTALLSLMIVLSATATTYAACTPITKLPTTITASGSYCLTGNLSFSSTGNGITINTGVNDVAIDLAGFEIKNTRTGNGYGINVLGVHNDVAIKNGRINGFLVGIYMSDGESANVVVDGVSVSFFGGSSTAGGILLSGTGIVVRNCQVNGNGVGNATSIAVTGGGGPGTGPGNSIINNDVFNTGWTGIMIGNGFVENNRVSGTTIPTDNAGILAFGDSVMVNNHVRNIGQCFVFRYGTHIYRDNLAMHCEVPYLIVSPDASAIDAGNNGQ